MFSRDFSKLALQSGLQPTLVGVVSSREMKKQQISRQLAKESRVSTVVAADQLDRVVSDLLMRVRKGESASLPGLGTFQPGSEKEFQFDRERAPKIPDAPVKKERK